MGDPLGEFLAAPPLFPEEELELTPAEGERLNALLLGEAKILPSPTDEDDGPPDYINDDDGPPEHALSGDESERDGGASGNASAGADNNSTGKGKGKNGYGKFGKSKWDNHPTQVPYRKGAKGGKRGPPKRSGGKKRNLAPPVLFVEDNLASGQVARVARNEPAPIPWEGKRDVKRHLREGADVTVGNLL